MRDYDPSLPSITVDRNQMIQAFLNVGRNAMQALGERGRLIFRTRALTNFTVGGERHRLVLSAEVEDNGPGIPAELKETIFYPLVTGRPTGTGLGLTIAQDLVSRNGGLIEFTSEPGRTVFQIRLPVANGAPLMATPGLSVWVVDDDESVRWVLEQALKQAHMFPRAFETGEEFFGALEARPARRADHGHPHAGHERARAHGAAHAHGSRHSRHRDHGALGSRQRRVGVSRRSVRVSAEAVRHRRGDRARLARGAAAQRADTAEQTTAKPTPRIIGQAPAMQEVFKAIGRLSRSSMTVLITGESGTGKELVARALHDNSPRADRRRSSR